MSGFTQCIALPDPELQYHQRQTKGQSIESTTAVNLNLITVHTVLLARVFGKGRARCEEWNVPKG